MWITKTQLCRKLSFLKLQNGYKGITEELLALSRLKRGISMWTLQHRRFSNLKRCRQFSHLSRERWDMEKTEGLLLLGWEDESVLSSKAKPGCILNKTGCAQMCCVFGFHYSSLQTHPQLAANTAPHPRCSSTVWLPPVYSAPEPQPVIYYLAVFCLTWVHTTSHTVAPSRAALPHL